MKVSNTKEIGNKIKRSEVYHKQKREREAARQAERERRRKERESLGDDAPPVAPARTLDNTREWDDTVIDKNDPELLADEADDEFADIFSGERPAKIMMTTRVRATAPVYRVVGELLNLFPNSFYYKRRNYELKKICKWADSKAFTHLVVVSEKKKKPNGLLVTKLPAGPTAFFKLSNFKFSKEIEGHGRPTSHNPEIILNRFDTRLGRRMGRIFGSMFPQKPDLVGRQAVTFHNQRDFIFVRRHRFICESDKKVRLQELGPRFTLKLRWLLADTFNTSEGEYEWFHKRHEMDKTRRKFHL